MLLTSHHEGASVIATLTKQTGIPFAKESLFTIKCLHGIRTCCPNFTANLLHISCSFVLHFAVGRKEPVSCRTSQWSPGRPSQNYPCRSAAYHQGWNTGSLQNGYSSDLHVRFTHILTHILSLFT